ncbi:hypothetical protein K502DRAFT_322937 [Neoconidiobolus thromboides FSU 785]|nr:hypothetical protein K502DRAFT_322937 [Neoconidiobolus thromboides FSU 785]
MDKINFTGASIEQRLHYMKLMHDKLIKQYQDKLIFSDIALTTSGKFIDKINVLSQVSRNKEMKYHFIMGYDTLIRVLDFKYYMKEYNYESMVETLKPFFLNGNIYYTKRGEEIVDKEMDKLLLRFKEKIVYFELLEKCHEEVSSTKVRQAIKDGDKEGKLKNMVDKDILKLVLEDNPYV